MKTYMASNDDVEKKWFVIDANGKTVGRLATKIATLLRGKGKPQFTAHADIGDFVIVLNAEKVNFTGEKWSQKKYYWYTGYPGGLRSITAEQLLKKKPEDIITNAVWGMLPKNKWQKRLISRLKVYKGNEHFHKSQKPVLLEL